MGSYNVQWQNDEKQLLRPTAAQNDIKESMQIAQGDLRKAQTHIDFCSDLADKGAHVYVGARDVLCRGIQKPLDYNERIWLWKSLSSKDILRKHAELATHFACADTLNDTNVVNEFAGIATFQLVGKTRSFFDLKRPPTISLCNKALDRVFSNVPW